MYIYIYMHIYIYTCIYMQVSSPQILGKVHGKDFRQVACGALHSIALTASGQLYSWGLNEDGQLGRVCYYVYQSCD